MKEIKPNIDGPTRLDRFLRREYSKLTQGVIEKALRTGQIKLNNKKSKTSDRINSGDIISLSNWILEFGNSQEKNKKTFSMATKSLASKLLSEYLIFQSEYFIAINKPCGLAVQGGSKISLSIDDALQYLNQEKNSDYKIVHRLDKNTSGILLIAKGQQNSAKIALAFKNKDIKKTYIAIVEGRPQISQGEISNYIGKNRTEEFEIVQEQEDGKLAITAYRVLSSNNAQSLIEFLPLTGRMHQLRFHSQFLGCPIIGDVKYGGRKNSRMLLHAKEIFLPKSIFGQEFTIEAKFDNDFQNSL